VLGGATIGFALIGLFDDLAGDTAVKGFAGHLGALRRGEVTSGLVKLVGGVLFGVLAVSGDVVDSLRGGLLVAATANLANLFDRAPGRVVKVSLLGGVVVAALGGLGWSLTGPLVVQRCCGPICASDACWATPAPTCWALPWAGAWSLPSVRRANGRPWSWWCC
jgi:hypothetical protein